ncbi:MAG: FecR family protein [Pseudohongiellaceae bacterium]
MKQTLRVINKLIQPIQFLVTSSATFSRTAAAAALAMLFSAVLSMTMPAGALASDTSNPDLVVGTVNLMLGKAWREVPGRRRDPIKVGSEIKVNDRILTSANGHVHVLFVDDALVSVRPDSRLEIVRYDYNSARPEQSSVKFNLVEGVTRAISGEAARSARDRFRLNTPIAAIGVRGTDFVVSATRDSVRALVNEGAIVLAPFSTECTAAAFGPCAVNAVELTDTSLQIIELDGTTPVPRLLAAPHERDPDMMQDEVRVAVNGAESADAEDKTAATDVYLENVTSTKVAAEAATATEPKPKPPAPLPEFTPEQPITTAALTSREMVWGRWGDGHSARERITETYATASLDREVTVGNDDYALFRTENGTKRVQPGLGVVSFSLNSAQAFYHSSTGVVAMDVNGGKLDIDFNRNRFDTQLNLNHSTTGQVDFSAAGQVVDGGYFYSRSDSQNIGGAVNRDASEAGYFFDKQLENGGIQGLTLWDKP